MREEKTARTRAETTTLALPTGPKLIALDEALHWVDADTVEAFNDARTKCRNANRALADALDWVWRTEHGRYPRTGFYA